MELRARNDRDAPAPYGVGQHPYVRAGTEPVDDAVLTVPAATRLLTDERGNPTGTEPVAGSPYDFREPPSDRRPRCSTPHSPTSRRDGDGRVRRTARASRGRHRGGRCGAAPGPGYLQVFSGDTLAPERRRRGLAVEPMSCPPGRVPSGTDLAVLEPARSTSWSWGLRAW